MTIEELQPLRELAEIHEREGRYADASYIRLLFLQFDRLTARVAELESVILRLSHEADHGFLELEPLTLSATEAVAAFHAQVNRILESIKAEVAAESAK